MELSYDSIRNILDHTFGDGDYDYCDDYGEPGYSVDTDKPTPMVVFANYWCKCGKVTNAEGNAQLHSYEKHHPHIWNTMAKQGVEFEWYDEWYVDSNSSKAYRTTGDSYSWQSSIQFTENGEVLTPDDDISEWIDWAVDDWHKCIPGRIWSSEAMITAGFEKFNGEYQNGWHEWMTDNPEKITKLIRREHGPVDIVFRLSEASQFYIGFEAWIKETDNED